MTAGVLIYNVLARGVPRGGFTFNDRCPGGFGGIVVPEPDSVAQATDRRTNPSRRMVARPVCMGVWIQSWNQPMVVALPE